MRQVTWQNRLENFLEWYLAAGKSAVATPWEKSYPVTWLDPAYPQELTALSEPPPVLYANHHWGSWPWPARRVAVIGSRSMSRYGQLMTQEVVSDLVEESEAAVISGGARGVDLTAQQQALQLSGQTIGVCGCGLGKITSRSQRQLLDHPQALWVSEFRPCMTPSRTLSSVIG